MSLFRLSGLSLNLAATCCFTDFSIHVEWGQKIALVGANGSGKSSLLKFLAQQESLCEGELIAEYEFSRAYLAQHLPATPHSGGEAVQHKLNQLLRLQPDLLLLDEPSNHLDLDHKNQLLRQLQHYHGSLILVSHELDWLEQCCDTFWIIEQQSIQVFHGRYRDWLAQKQQQRLQLQARKQQLKQRQQAQHHSLMQEQTRAAHARQRGVQAIKERRWATIRSATKLGRGNSTSAAKRAKLTEDRQQLACELRQLAEPESIQAEFFLPPCQTKSSQAVLQLSAVAFGYQPGLRAPLYLQLMAGQRCLLQGRNGSGKSSLLKAIRNHPAERQLRLAGEWHTPAEHEIAYLDQHYSWLDQRNRLIDFFAQHSVGWTEAQRRQHLARFLLRGEICQRACIDLSGGEKVRLSLAILAAKVPRLLLLDEPINHLDYGSRQDLLEVLQQYPGTLILVSHDTMLSTQLEFDLKLDLSA